MATLPQWSELVTSRKITPADYIAMIATRQPHDGIVEMTTEMFDLLMDRMAKLEEAADLAREFLAYRQKQGIVETPFATGKSRLRQRLQEAVDALDPSRKR